MFLANVVFIVDSRSLAISTNSIFLFCFIEFTSNVLIISTALKELDFIVATNFAASIFSEISFSKILVVFMLVVLIA
jgi:hypothetical protein